MTATMVTGAGSTATVNTSHQVRDVTPELKMLDSDEMPLQYILSQAGSRSASLYKFEWAEFGGSWYGAGNYPRWDAVNGTTGTGTSIVVDNGPYFNVGDIVKVVRTGELMKTTAVVTNTLTVVRGVGSTAAAAVADNDDLLIIPSGFAEGTAAAIANLAQETFVYNYCQLFKTAASLNNTETAGKNYLGDARALERMKALRKHKEGIENAFLYGERNRITTDTSAPINLSGGLLYWLTTNTLSSAATLTFPEFETFIASVFAHTGGSGTRTLFMSSLVTSVLDQIAGGALHVTPRDETFGIHLRQWLTSHGTLNLIKHRFLDQGAQAAAGTVTGGYAGSAFALDMSRIRARYLRPMKLETNVQAPGDDLWKDQYLSEVGLEVANAALHGYVSGVTG